MVSSNDIQRLFLQAVLSRGVLSVNLAQILWEKSTEAVRAANPHGEIEPYRDERAAWDLFVGKINDSLNSLDLEFRHLNDEQTGREMYALVNRKGDDIAQMATDYNPAEITYFKAIVEQIMLAPREAYSISSLAALREVNALKSNMTTAQAENVLGSFVAKGWLFKSKRGRYSLSTRTLLELLPYLKSTYPDEYLECTICMEILTRGIACHTPNCKTRMHPHCFKNYRRGKMTCPACSLDWPAEAQKPLLLVGEGAVKDGQEDGRRARRRSAADGSDEEGESMQMDEDEPSQSTMPSKPHSQPQHSQKKKTGKKAKKSERDMDVDDDDVDKNRTPTQTQANGRRRSGRLQ